MRVVKTIPKVRTAVRQWRREGLSVGLVTTMGYLHDGHKSLIERAAHDNDRVVVTDFVNPTQFGPNEDFETYPRDLNHDCVVCEDAGANVMFCPEPDELYFPDACTTVTVSGLTEELCGKTRPTHFQGVCTVVSKFFNIVQPDRAYFGQKDAQQLSVIMRMVRDLNFDIEVVGCPIVREPDGLAKSSRNAYLSDEERKAAVVLSKAVFTGEKMVRRGERETLPIIDVMERMIAAEPLARIDYVKVVDFETITPVDRITDRTVLGAVAVYIGKTRLIDNFIFTPHV